MTVHVRINDVLLESSEKPYLTAQSDLVKTTTVALWLVLNFKYFCSGITKGMKESGFKSGFVQIVQEKLKYYDEVTSPCEPRDAMEEEPWTWGPPREQDEPAEKLHGGCQQSRAMGNSYLVHNFYFISYLKTASFLYWYTVYNHNTRRGNGQI